VEHQFVCTFFGVAFCQRHDIANDFMVAKLYAFHHLTITNVETRNYAFCQHAMASFTVNLPSSNARPTITPRTPVPRRAATSSMSPIPPEDCNATCGYLAHTSSFKET